jgi:glycosyltransferase involved in cell wall biosynthesis
VTVARAAAGSDARISIVEATHRGKGAAVKRGMRQASGRWRLLADADLATSIDQIDAFISAIVPGETDIVIGSREAARAVRIDQPWYRHAIGRGFNWAPPRCWRCRSWQIEVAPRLLRLANSDPATLYRMMKAHFTHFIDLNVDAAGPRLRSIAHLDTALEYLERGEAPQTDVVVYRTL